MSTSQNGASTSNGQNMFDIQFNTVPSKMHVYERFKLRLFEGLDYRKRDAAISLHKIIRFVEKTVRVLDSENVLYRCLVVFKGLKDCTEKPNNYESEYLRVHLCEILNDEIIGSLAKAVTCVRAIVGMKHFHETVVLFWRESLENPAANADPVYLNNKANQQNLELPFILGNPTQIVQEAGRILGTSIPIYGEQPRDSVQFESEFIRWNKPFVEKLDNSSGAKENGPQLVPDEDNLDCDTLVAYINELPEPDIALSQLTKILNSARSNDEVQYELIELLGVDYFELIIKILEDRRSFANYLTESARRAKRGDTANYEPLNSNTSQARFGDRYAGQANMQIQTKKDAQLRKEKRKEEKKLKREIDKIVVGLGSDERLEFELMRQQQLKEKRQELTEGGALLESRLVSGYRTRKNLPYVFDAYDSSPFSDIDVAGIKMTLPVGTERRITSRYQEVVVPAQEKTTSLNVHPIRVDSLDPIGQIAFTGFTELNQIQSIVFDQAYKTLENLLICAPTGAGKTNIAMLSVLKTIRDHCDEQGIMKDAFKIIYIAPMKALATEMTQNFSTRLSKLGLKVKEWTGDTQLSKREIQETQMLVLTPEKWDVVTRKIDDEALTQLVRLIIIDEVHLLHDERGPVIETIVARTLRQMEVYQQSVRIVGLSATLPNYLDVATFLRVDPEKGLFFFDGRFRPVPLTQTFIGVSEPNSGQIKPYMDEACYDKCIDFLREGHQVLVFVHSRGATAQLAKFLLERASLDNSSDAFLPPNITTPMYQASLKKVKTARNRELFDLFQKGIGCHHAGLLRQDRLLMEKVFSEGHVRVLVCTATLAWGVNLPAHAVIIRGTDVFDPNKGAFSDLGVLDVQQIFGRAGRPQFENEGHGIIITSLKNLNKYVSMLIRQAPIESRFQSKICDNLNAEIARGTVSTVAEAVEWLTYTYFFIRARLNPLVYGIDYKEVRQDPTLTRYLQDLCFNAAQKLDNNQMIRFDMMNSFMNSTDLGRIASHFYITYESIETFLNHEAPVRLMPNLNDDQILSLICASSEFSQIQCREQEMADLDELKSAGCVHQFRGGGLATTQGKANCLLQSYISRAHVNHSTLASETNYVAENASRIARALFEIVLRKEWSHTAVQCLNFSKFITRKLWSWNSPLKQISDVNLLKEETVRKVEASRQSFFELLDYTDSELGALFKCDGRILYDSIRMIPSLEAEATIKPITQTIVRVDAQIWPAFTWNTHLLGENSQQRFHLLIEDTDSNTILHHEQLFYTRKKVQNEEVQRVTVTIPIDDNQMRNHFQLRIMSDDWVVEDTQVPISTNNQVLPESIRPHTDLLDLDPLPISALKNEEYQNLYPFQFFNPVQTQVFFALYHTWDNCLIGAPTSSGKTLCAELAIFRLLQNKPNKKCVYVAPLKALVRERVKDWKDKFTNQLGIGIVEVSGDHTPQMSELQEAQILITTPEKWDGITRSYDTRAYVRDVSLVVIDEIHLLGVERGAVLESIITRLKIIGRTREKANPVRIVGLSTALANALDIADWLQVPESGLFNFRPSVRPVPIKVHIQGFHGPHYCPRMALMNKPAFKAILEHSPVKPTLIFVASRRQTRLTAMAFVSLLAQEPNPKQWLHMEQQELHDIVQTLKDENLKITLPFGIALHHAGLQAYERNLVENLFVERKIQVLVATATLAWGINVPAHLVIIKGTEYYDGKTHKYVDFPVTDVLQMIGRAGRPQYDDSAVAVVYVQDVKKKFYKRFLYEPFPVESSLLPVLPNHVNAEIASGTILNRQDIMTYLADTYLYRRLFANPNYYDIEEFNDQSLINFLTKIIDDCLGKLSTSNCIMQDEGEDSLRSTPFGILASKYYLNHTTIRHFSERLRPGVELIELLRVLTDCPEYAEIPVRHNENLINEDMNPMLRFPIEDYADFESSNVKAYLLYQAYFSRMKVHVDYLTDQRSIIESCIRIIQTILDFSVLKGWLDVSINAVVLLQQVIQGRWFDDHPLLCLPHTNYGIINGIGRSLTVPQLQNELGINKLEKMPDEQKRQEYQKVLTDRSAMESYQAKEFIDALLKWPILQLVDFKLQQGNLECPVDPFGYFEGKPCSPAPLKAGEEYRLKITVRTVGPARSNPNVCSSVYSKDKTVGYVLLLGIQESNTVLACRKTGPIVGSKPSTFHLNFKAPKQLGKQVLTAYVLSDSYLNIDQQYDFGCDIKNF